MVHKFRFLDKNQEFCGPVYVAKESRFVEEGGAFLASRMDFHRNFMRTQAIAADLAKRFNQDLDNLPNFFEGGSDHTWLHKMPRIEFLEPLVVEVFNSSEKGAFDMLIEPMLEGEYTKFNNNMGYVKDQAKSVSREALQDLAKSMKDLDLGMGRPLGSSGIGLGAIEEGSEEEESDDDSDEEDAFDNAATMPTHGSYSRKYEINDFPQAFSHYTYERSKGTLIVVDLQGVRVQGKQGERFMLTDPVIHQRKKRRERARSKKKNFGRTDKKGEGMKAFFVTHKCTQACRLFGLKPVRPEYI